MLLLSVLLAIIMARRVSKPIEEISASAAILAKGDYDVHFEGEGFAEIVALSDTLNTTAKELGKVEGLRRELLANVSHDLRTPLALIYSYAEMMHDFPDEITPEQPGTIMEETRRLTTLVNDVLDISKLESDMETLNREEFSFTESIADAVTRMNELLSGDNFHIAFTRDSDVIVNADEAKISRAFYNLLINAVNYSGDSREVSVAQTLENGFVRVSIADYGEGIAEDELPFIWDRYYKSGKKHRRAVTGTGLGLSIAKKIIELHGGRYGVSSEAGKGSMFWFEIEACESV
jgi:signal transduction histidine kinase